MAVLISAALFALLAVLITYYGYRVYARPGRVFERLGAPAVLTASPLADAPADAPLVRIVQHIGEKVPISPADASLQKRELLAAGYRSENALAVFYGIKVVACLVTLLLGILLVGSVTTHPILGKVFIIGCAALGWLVPGIVLGRQISKRQETLRLSLPDALDLMVVCVEAGLGLDQAFVNVSRELHLTHKEICEEFGLVTLEMRAGKRRAEALHNLAERSGEMELRKLVAILIQADRFGTSIAESLRTHADFMRIRRRQLAEERAGKVGVKLVFPIFFFILPSMLIVTAGPGMLQVLKYLFPMMKSFQM